MSNYSHVWLIAKRDFAERVKTKAFRFGTLVMAIAVAASVVLPALLNSDSTPVRTVAIAGQAPNQLSNAIVQLGPATSTDIRVVNVANAQEGEELLRTDRASVVLVPQQEIITASTPQPSAGNNSSTLGLVSSINELNRLYQGLDDAGLTAAQADAVVQSDALPVRGLDANSDEANASEFSGAATGVVIAVFIFLLIYTAWVVNGVVEEKTSRVVEVLLSTIKARELLAGKVLGTALVAGLQGSLLVAAVLLSQFAVSDQGSNAIGLDLRSVLYGFIWLLAGYLLYAWMYAAAGAMATKTQDAQSLTFPIQIPLLIGYVMSIGASVGGATQLVTIMSFIPFTAPMAMLTRMTIGDAQTWEVLLALGITLATAAVVMRLTIVVYTGAILRTGQRTKLREAWKSARA